MTTWQRSEEWIGSQVDDSLVMISVEDGTYVALNSTAASAWELLAEPRDEDALVAAFINKFAVDSNHCRAAVRALLSDMIARKLVHPAF